MNPMKGNLAGLRANVKKLRKSDLQSRYGPGATGDAGAKPPDSRPVPGTDEEMSAGTADELDPGSPLEGSPEEEAGETPAEAASEPDAASATLGEHSTADDVVAALQGVPPDVLKDAMAQLMSPDDGTGGGDGIDSQLGELAGRLSSSGHMEG